MDRERRCLEYAIYHREQLDLKRQLNEVLSFFLLRFFKIVTVKV